MVTQKIVTRLSNDVLPPVRMVSGDVGREIQLEIYANDDSLAPIDLETYSARITIIKPDKTFVIQDFDHDKVELPEQAGAVTGHGYYQIKIYTAGDHQIYTGQGAFIVDDDVLSDEMIESVAEVNGYEFPDDFLTDADLREYVTKHELEDALAGIIDDDTTDYNSTWSSAKINEALTSVTKTATGKPIEFTDGADAPLVKCVTQITGSQDLHGYDKPWVGGAGKNKLPLVLANIKSANTSGTWSGNVYTTNGVTITVNTDADGNVTSVKVNGTASAVVDFKFAPSFTLPAGTYIASNEGSGTNYYGQIENGSTWSSRIVTGSPQTITYRADSIIYHYYVANGVTVSNIEVHPMIRLATETDSTFTPYSNICPITAYTEGEIEVSDGNGNVTTHTTTYPSAIYRGSEDCVKGTATTEWGVIASYAGETLPGEWISDRDEYAPGTTPTTGAQVAYKLATPTTASIVVSNYPIKSLAGYSHIESYTGEMEVEYITQTYDAIMEATKLDNMKVYSTDEQVVGKWVDGSDLKEKTYIYTGTGAANPFTATIDFTGKSIIEVIPHYAKYTYGGGTVGYCAGSKLTESNSSVLKVEYDDATPPTVNVTSYLGSSTDTYEIAFTIRYI